MSTCDGRELLSFSSHLFLSFSENFMSNKVLDPILVVSDRNGIYIPQMYCNHIDEKIAEEMHVPFEDVQICQSGPEHEWYWESWQIICDSAEWVSDGVKWGLYQDGDLWEVPEGFSFDEEY